MYINFAVCGPWRREDQVQERGGRAPRASDFGPGRLPVYQILLSSVFSSQPPKRVPFRAITGRSKVLPDCERTPMPQGLETRMSARLSPVRSRKPANGCPGCSAASPRSGRRCCRRPLSRRSSTAFELQDCDTAKPGDEEVVAAVVGEIARAQPWSLAVSSAQPPKSVPFGLSISRQKVLPLRLRIPIPQGLRTTISSLPSASKSPTGPKRLSAVLRSQPSNRVPLGLSAGVEIVPPSMLKMPMPQGLRHHDLVLAVGVEVADGAEAGCRRC